MAQELAENRNLSSYRKSLPGNVPEMSSTADIAKLIARCLANYGERKGIDMRLVSAEWHATLGAYPMHRLNNALSEHIRTSTFWPTIANFVELLRQETPAPGLPRYRRDEKLFSREGRTEAEEIAHRAAQTLRWKQEARRDHPEVPDPIEAKSPPKAASQARSISYALYHSCAARRARGEETCQPNCQKPQPGTRECRMDKFNHIEAGLDDLDVSQPTPATEPHQ